MQIKGFRSVRPLGMLANGADCWYFYYDIPDGLLELEVSCNPATGQIERKVVALISEPDRLELYLGRR